MDKIIEENENRRAEYAKMSPEDADRAKKERRDQFREIIMAEQQRKFEERQRRKHGFRDPPNELQDFDQNRQQPGQYYVPPQPDQPDPYEYNAQQPAQV